MECEIAKQHAPAESKYVFWFTWKKNKFENLLFKILQQGLLNKSQTMIIKVRAFLKTWIFYFQKIVFLKQGVIFQVGSSEQSVFFALSSFPYVRYMQKWAARGPERVPPLRASCWAVPG